VPQNRRIYGDCDLREGYRFNLWAWQQPIFKNKALCEAAAERGKQDAGTVDNENA
jgi:hypothetical protein